MKHFKKIAGYNLLIMLGLALILALAFRKESGQYGPMSFMVFYMVVIGGQVVINLLTSISLFATKKPGMGKSFLLTSLILLLVGFSSCFGISGILG